MANHSHSPKAPLVWDALHAVGLGKIISSLFGLMLIVVTLGMGINDWWRSQVQPAEVERNTREISAVADTLETHLSNARRQFNDLTRDINVLNLAVDRLEQQGDSIFSAIVQLDLSVQRSLCRADGNSADYCERTIRR